MSENQGARLKIGPLICIPPEDRYNNTLQLRLQANEDKIHSNEEAIMATKTDLVLHIEHSAVCGFHRVSVKSL